MLYFARSKGNGRCKKHMAVSFHWPFHLWFPRFPLGDEETVEMDNKVLVVYYSSLSLKRKISYEFLYILKTFSSR
jgi:hypothetical protein